MVVEKIYNQLFLLNNPIWGAPASKSPSIEQFIQSKIREYVNFRSPVLLVLPAFPAKSPNRNKTLGALPDLGEVYALQRLENLCNTIQEFYAPGARVLICSDGRVFSDLVGVSDSAVNSYSEGLREIFSTFQLRNIDLFNLDDVFLNKSFSEMRDSLIHTYGESVEDIRQKVKTLETERLLFNGIHRFVFEDYLSLPEASERSRSWVREETKKVAYQVVQRSQAWSRLVEEFFPQAVRLSIHPQLPESSKIPVRFLPGDHQWQTPWHSVLLKQNGVSKLTTKKQALSLGASLHQEDGKWGFFQVASC